MLVVEVSGLRGALPDTLKVLSGQRDRAECDIAGSRIGVCGCGWVRRVACGHEPQGVFGISDYHSKWKRRALPQH